MQPRGMVQEMWFKAVKPSNDLVRLSAAIIGLSPFFLPYWPADLSLAVRAAQAVHRVLFRNSFPREATGQLGQRPQAILPHFIQEQGRVFGHEGAAAGQGIKDAPPVQLRIGGGDGMGID